MNEDEGMHQGLLYVPQREVCASLDLGEYESFGIAVFENTELLAYVPDISANEGLVAELAQRCTRGQLSLTHLFDVIEDFLGR